jgi:phosphoribosylformylglycinamidine synthase
VHDLSDGGLAVTLCEMAFGGGFGFSVDLRATGLPSPGLALAAEGASRWVVEVAAGRERAFERSMRPTRVARLGTVEPGAGRWSWRGATLGSSDLEHLYERWRAGPE